MKEEQPISLRSESPRQKTYHEPVVIYDAQQQDTQAKELLTRKELASAIGRPHNLKKVNRQLERIMENDPSIQPQTLEVQGRNNRRYRTIFFGTEALEELLKINQITLPDGQVIKANGGPEWQDVLQTLISARDNNELTTKGQLVTNIPELKDLPAETSANKLNQLLEFLNKKLKTLNSSGWQVRNINAQGLALITQQERETDYYTVQDVKSATNKSSRTIERYLTEMLGGRIKNILLTEDTYNDAILYIQSQEWAKSQKLTKDSLTFPDGELTFPDGTPIPNLRVRLQEQLLMQLINASKEERPFYIQESFDPADSSPIARRFAEWYVRRRIKRLDENKDMKRTGWVIDSLTKDAYFIKQKGESPQELRELLGRKRKIHINSTALVLDHLTQERPSDNLNLRNIHILLANALRKSYPDIKLPEAFKDTSSEHLKKFFHYGFVHTLERLWERKGDKTLSLEEKEIVDSCQRLEQIGWDTQKIINFVKTHFSVPTRGDEKLSA